MDPDTPGAPGVAMATHQAPPENVGVESSLSGFWTYCLVRLEPPDGSAPIYYKNIPIFIVYIENARSTSTTTLAFTIATGGTWKIKVSQIECYNLARGVPDCDQYLTGISGIVKSYNWPNIQLRNKDWTFCIRREEGM